MEVSWAQRCRTTQTHERNPLPSFIATGRHEHIPPSRHSSQRAATSAFPLLSFIATGHHERIPSSCHSSQRATPNAFPPPVIHRNGPPRAHSPLPSFPRRRESGCAIHEPFCECIQ